ncbi:MAG TPA: DUF3891 family protein [Terriglobales bacterium]|nr:DUF3891 family protein [Terriglobales bacterium]
MILRPRNPLPPSTSDFVPAWDAVLRTQKQSETEWQLIAQADHAALAAEIADKIANPDFPKLEAEVIQAIAVHDDGWKQIDERPTKSGHPLSFFEEAPADIFRAWKGSIAAATQIAPITGILVSEHFCRIARDFARASTTPSEVAQVLTTFVEREISQQEELREQQNRDAKEINLLVDVLQFFDLLSLYICCGSKENVEFPQRFNQKMFRAYREADKYRLEPSFDRPTSFSIKATSSLSTEDIAIYLI